MPHVSPKRVSKQVLAKLYSLLFSTITYKNVSETQHKKAFEELLTPTEKVMFGKRIAAVTMISNYSPSDDIVKKLQLSPTTVSKIRTKVEEGEYKNLQELCHTLENGPFKRYIKNLLKPLPRYGTSVTTVFKDQ